MFFVTYYVLIRKYLAYHAVWRWQLFRYSDSYPTVQGYRHSITLLAAVSFYFYVE